MKNLKNIEDNPNLEVQALEMILESVNRIGRQYKLNDGDPVPVIVDGELGKGHYSDSGTMGDTALARSGVPDCSTDHCNSVRDQINRICKDNGWPAGHAVLVCDGSTGKCCNCYCT